MSKQYGLIKPGNVFGSSDSEDESKSTNKKQQPFGQNILQKKQVEKQISEHIAEDPSIFLYDEIYDDIQNKRIEIKKEKKAQDAKKPKYINKLIETAEKRKKEYERRVERQVQKERIAEGEKFKDKESFVTATYRQKLEEMKEAELQEKRQEYLESIGDVTKQADLSGFYRHIYSQKMGDDETKDVQKAQEPIKAGNEKTNKKKNYRKRESSDEEMSEKLNEPQSNKNMEHINSNIDADSDFSVDSSSDESDKKKLAVIQPLKEEIKAEPTDSVTKCEEEKVEQMVEEINEIIKKPKVDIWAKRTVGDALMEALKRYQERKALRENSMR